jgi:GT2 family glycosyltransferase
MVPYYPSRDFGASHCSSERTGVTGACLVIRRELYLAVGGMSPAFPGSFNDVDLCFRLRELGYRVVWTPLAEFFHFESLTRDPSIDAGTDALLKSRWAHLIVDDEYYPTAPIPVNGELYKSPFITRAERTPW